MDYPHHRESRRTEDALAAAYERERRKSFPQWRMTQRVREYAVWERIAEWIEERGIDPEAYISAQFLSAPGGVVFPQALFSEKAKANCETYESDGVPFKVRIFEVQMAKLRNMVVRVGFSVDEALAREDEDFLDSLRIVNFSERGFVQHGEKFLQGAIREVAESRGLAKYIEERYDAAYERIVPKKVPAEPPGPPVESPPVQGSHLKGRGIRRRL